MAILIGGGGPAGDGGVPDHTHPLPQHGHEIAEVAGLADALGRRAVAALGVSGKFHGVRTTDPAGIDSADGDWYIRLVDTGAGGGGAAVPVSWGSAAGWGSTWSGDYALIHGLPTGIVAGDLIVVAVACRPSTPTLAATLSDDVGGTFTRAVDGVGGVGTVAADTGPSRVAIYTKPATGGETEVTIPIPGGTVDPATFAGYVWSFTVKKTTGTWDAPLGTTGADGVHDTTWSASGGSNLALAAGDMLVVCSVQDNDTAAWNSTAVSASGAGLGALDYRRDEPTDAGADLRFRLLTVPVASGASTAPPVHSGNLAAAACGVTAFVRLRATTSASGAVKPTIMARVAGIWVGV